MADYKETEVVGNSFSRCRQIEINNPYLTTPSVIFTEERITNLADRILRDQPDAPIKTAYDPTALIAIYDPVTLLPTGATVTMQEIYGLMFSAYFHFATKRDIEARRVHGNAAAVASADADVSVQPGA